MGGARGPLPWLAGLLTLYLLLPLAAFLVRLAAAGGASFAVPGLASALATSVASATLSALLIAVLGVPLGYALAHGRGWPVRWLGVAVQLPLALPPLMSGILLLYVVGPYTPVGGLFRGGLTDSFAGIVLAQVFVASPFLVVAARSAFAAVDPAFDDVARTLGHGGWQRFVRVSLPIALPGIRAGLLLAWLRAFGEFGATVVLAYHPYSLPVFTYVQFGGTGLAATLAPVAVALGAAVVVLLLADRPTTRRRRAPAELPEAAPPPAGGAPGLAFALDKRLGTFTLAIQQPRAARHLALLGPSGAGKSLTLRLLAGLAAPDAGQVRWGAQVLSALPPERRQVGYLPQSASLFPHLSVWEQVTFGRGVDERVASYWLRQFHLDGLAGRYPDQLSGGQQRRVALARALARNPGILLLDEPFTGLDAPVRDELRRELRRLQRDSGMATVLVTHDPEEAALLADEVIVLAHGQALQAGSRASVYARPASTQVARLLGIRNRAQGRVVAPGVIESAGVRLKVTNTTLRPGDAVSWCIRPEHIRLRDDGEMIGTVVDAVDLGATWEVVVRLGAGLELTARVADATGWRPGRACRVAIAPEAVNVWRDERAAETSGAAARAVAARA